MIIIIVYEITLKKKKNYILILSTELFLTSGACAPHKKFNILQRTSDDVSTWSNPIKQLHICAITYRYSGNPSDNNIEPFNDFIYGTNKIHPYTFYMKKIKPSEHIDVQYGVTTKVRNSIFSLERIFHYGEKKIMKLNRQGFNPTSISINNITRKFTRYYMFTLFHITV